MGQYKIIGFIIILILFTSCGGGSGSTDSQTSQNDTQNNTVSINDNSNILSTPSMPDSEDSPNASNVAQ